VGGRLPKMSATARWQQLPCLRFPPSAEFLNILRIFHKCCVAGQWKVIRVLESMRVNQELVSDFEEAGRKVQAGIARRSNHFKFCRYWSFPHTRYVENSHGVALVDISESHYGAPEDDLRVTSSVTSGKGYTVTGSANAHYNAQHRSRPKYHDQGETQTTLLWIYARTLNTVA
jgi:hypothetical protein